jgi:putative sugar O-methyltransferase
MYEEYIDFLKSNDFTNLENNNFKSNHHYVGVLEHVTYDLGVKYLKLIETEFTHINYKNIIGFIEINDKYGKPNKQNFIYKENNILCSPTSLRYIYHALIILDHYKNTNCENIVEVGCGYGGLCLAINYFSKLNNIFIKNYNLVDLPEVLNLIDNYLKY